MKGVSSASIAAWHATVGGRDPVAPLEGSLDEPLREIRPMRLEQDANWTIWTRLDR
jgi:hypothetical protein